MVIILLKGKQYKLLEGKEIIVPNLGMKVGEEVQVKDLLTNKDVTVSVVGESRSPKIRVIKFRRKTRYKRTIGSRMNLYTIKVKSEEKKSEKEVKKDKKILKKVAKK